MKNSYSIEVNQCPQCNVAYSKHLEVCPRCRNNQKWKNKFISASTKKEIEVVKKNKKSPKTAGRIKRIIIGLIVCILIPFIVFLAIKIKLKNQWKDFSLALDKAYSSIDQGNFEQACIDFDKALAISVIKEEHKKLNFT